MVGFGGNFLWSFGSQNCPALGWRALANGECRMWGNPIAEMMYESLRYYAGAAAATPAYATGGSAVGVTEETEMGLPAPSWQNPYRPVAQGGFPSCARPNMTVISDVNPSYDSALPGNAFGETGPDGTTVDLGNHSAVLHLGIRERLGQVVHGSHARGHVAKFLQPLVAPALYRGRRKHTCSLARNALL
jgi:hypothetical protein